MIAPQMDIRQETHRQWRILVVENDPVTLADHLRNLNRWGFEAHAAQGRGEALLQDALDLARQYRCHLALVDMRLLDDDDPKDVSGFMLIEQLAPLPAFVVSSYGSLQKASQAISRSGAKEFIGKEEGPRRLRSAIEDFFREYCGTSRYHGEVRWFAEWKPDKIIRQLFDDRTLVQPLEVECVVRRLFDEQPFHQAKTLRFSAILGATRTVHTHTLQHSVVFRVNADELQPVVIKIAPAAQIEAEHDNYIKYIWQKLPESRHSYLQQHALIGYAGGIRYGFLGAAAGGLRTLADCFEEMTADDINRCIDIFFQDTWNAMYQRRIPCNKSLFRAYAEVWGNKWIERIQDFPVTAPDLAFTSSNLYIKLPNPVAWLMNRTDLANAYTNDVTASIFHYKAVTHGDLHCRNIFVDRHGEPWIIDYERTGEGPILRDFVELELDFLRQFLSTATESDLSLFQLFVALLEPSQFTAETKFRQHKESSAKLLSIINNLRILAYSVAHVPDAQQYYWGLLFDIVFTLTHVMGRTHHLEDDRFSKTGMTADVTADATAISTTDSTLWNILLFGSMICYRLDYWERPWPPKHWSSVGATQRKAENSMNYETGLNALKQFSTGADWLSDFTLYEARLRENLRDEQRFGPSSQTSQERYRIVDQLNMLALARLSISFNDLCMGKQPNNEKTDDELSKGQQGKGQGSTSSSTQPIINSNQAWALLVGVNHYENDHINDLKVCVADVTAIQQSLGIHYKAAQLLTDATSEQLPTRANILSALSTVAQATTEGDLLLFYFSGHGIAEAGESYLLPRDARIAALKHTSVTMREVREIMDKSPARAKVIILDACHSGAAIGKTESVMTEEFIQRVFEEAEGMAVLASCKQGQKSWEWAEHGRSVFTYYLLEALAGQADFDQKGFVTISDVNRYVTDGVKHWALQHSAPQTPTLQSAMAGDIMLVRYQ